MTEREKIAGRIRALAAKTVENGCTEGEAIAAAAMLAKLLAQYNMTLDEAELAANPFARHTERHEDPVGDRLWKVADASAYLTGARFWTSAAGVWPREINFFGFDHEVEVARYMLEICAGAMRREHQRLKDERYPRVLKRAVEQPFLDGMADRLRQRIRDLKPPEPTGKGLVVLRGALIDKAMNERGIALRDRNMRGSRSLDLAYLDGVIAGDRVALNRGVRGGQARRLLS